MKSTVLFLLGIILLDQCGVQGTLIIRSHRCSCINTSRGSIHYRSLRDLKQFAPSPHCNKTEVIATLKNGTQTCLNPDSANVKKLMKEWEKQISQKKKQKRGRKQQKWGRKQQKNKKTGKAKKPKGPPAKTP